MSCNYAEGLSPYHDKGQLGLEEKFDSKAAVASKVTILSKWVNEAKHVVIHTGAGISTSAGIPDFRGPQGVWTLEAKGEKPELNKDFNEAIPTITHMAIMKLVEKGKVKFVVSQNIDGLHLRSNLPRKFLSELHGNMFTEQCSACNRQFVRSTAAPSVGQKSLNKPCPTTKTNGRPCRGRLHDTILDWEHNLPENDLGMADYHSCLADLSICLGTTMQIVPSGNLPLYTKKHGGRLVIVNLQPTKHDKKADLLIHAYVDEVMTMLMKNLNIKIPKYSPKNDPSRNLSSAPEKFIEWTISDSALKKMKKIYEEKCGSKEAKKRLEMIEDDIPLSITKTFKRKAKDDDDSDLEVVDVIVQPPKKTKESSKKGPKKNTPPVYNTTITIKKVTPTPKKTKHEGAEKITIKKNVTNTKTKYEIVTKPKKVSDTKKILEPKKAGESKKVGESKKAGESKKSSESKKVCDPKKNSEPKKCEIVYSTDNDLCNDLDMVCESDDDEMTNSFTYNFKRYLYEDVKKEVKDENSKEIDKKEEVKEEVKSEIKTEDVKEKATAEEKVAEIKEESSENKEEDAIEKTNTERNSTNIVEDKQPEPMEIVSDAPSRTVEKTSENESSVKENTEKSKEKQSEKGETETVPAETLSKDENAKTEVITPMEIDKEPTAEKTIQEKELAELVGTKEPEKPDKDCSQNKDKSEKTESLLKNIESELSNLTNSNLEGQIDQMSSSRFDNSLGVSNCNVNSSINENYEFYNNEYNSTNNPTDLDYYNNF